MTKNNEQIIIDDLDTRCPYHSHEKYGHCNNPSSETKAWYCVHNKDCIYKQYAHKEQECEELKDKLRTKARGWANVNDQILKEVDQLKKELESTKGLVTVGNRQLVEALKENEKLKKEIKDLLEKPEIQDKILWKIEDKKMTEGLNLRIYVLEQALKEIKEFVENETTPNCDTNIILQKIKEVENAN